MRTPKMLKYPEISGRSLTWKVSRDAFHRIQQVSLVQPYTFFRNLEKRHTIIVKSSSSSVSTRNTMHECSTGCTRRCCYASSMASRYYLRKNHQLGNKSNICQGGDDTFGTFPEDLRRFISHALPKITVAAVTYPQFETRGDLNECVGRFRDWLVITESPH